MINQTTQALFKVEIQRFNIQDVQTVYLLFAEYENNPLQQFEMKGGFIQQQNQTFSFSSQVRSDKIYQYKYQIKFKDNHIEAEQLYRNFKYDKQQSIQTDKWNKVWNMFQVKWSVKQEFLKELEQPQQTQPISKFQTASKFESIQSTKPTLKFQTKQFVQPQQMKPFQIIQSSQFQNQDNFVLAFLQQENANECIRKGQNKNSFLSEIKNVLKNEVVQYQIEETFDIQMNQYVTTFQIDFGALLKATIGEQLINHLSNLKQINSEQAKMIKEQNEEIQNLQNQKEHNKAQYDILEEKKQDLELRIQNLKQTNEDLEQKKQDLELRNQNLKQTNEDLELKNQDLQKQINNNTNQYQDLQTEYENFKNYTSDTILKFKQELEERKQQEIKNQYEQMRIQKLVYEVEQEESKSYQELIESLKKYQSTVDELETMKKEDEKQQMKQERNNLFYKKKNLELNQQLEKCQSELTSVEQKLQLFDEEQKKNIKYAQTIQLLKNQIIRQKEELNNYKTALSEIKVKLDESEKQNQELQRLKDLYEQKYNENEQKYKENEQNQFQQREQSTIQQKQLTAQLEQFKAKIQEQIKESNQWEQKFHESHKENEQLKRELHTLGKNETFQTLRIKYQELLQLSQHLNEQFKGKQNS